MPQNKITLANLGGGGLLADADRVLSKVCENIADPNTLTEVERKITITIKLNPDPKGRTVAIAYQIKSDLAGPAPGAIVAILAMGGDKQLGLFDSDRSEMEFQYRPKSGETASA